MKAGLAVGVALVLAGAVGAAVLPSPSISRSVEPAPAQDHGGHHHGSDAAAQDAPSGERWRAPEDGHVPSAADASRLPLQLRSLRAVTDEGLAQLAREGVLAGRGTLEEPYVLDGARVRGDLEVRDTSAPIVIRNSLVEGQLKLNYNGAFVHVHHNRVFDLRVNENVKRTADTTAGIFEGNAMAFIGQLRHFSGLFLDNDVGPRPEGVVGEFLGDAGPQPLPEGLVWNFDGYHGALVQGNKVLGAVDVKLHGHHHGSCLDCVGHDHAASDPDVDHRTRFHALRFEDNAIEVERGWALRFNDRNHAGDDRTANSEPNTRLDLEHAHATLLHVAGNVMRGGPLVLDVVNAPDERHEGHAQRAEVHLLRNHVTLPLQRGWLHQHARAGAYEVDLADNLTLVAEGNRFGFEDAPSLLPAGSREVAEPAGEAAGFLFERSNGAALVARTTGEGAQYGVLLARAEQLALQLEDNLFQAKEDVHHG